MDDVQALRAVMEAGFEAMKERFDDERGLQLQRHTENIGRLASIEREVRHTNGRVTRNEEQIKSLFAQGRRHDSTHEDDTDDAKTITRIDLRYLLAAFIGGAALLAWLLHLIGKI